MHSEGYVLFERFWWLIFPVFGMGMGVVRMLLRHARSNRTIEILKAYAEQGKEPPPEVLAALRQPDYGRYAGKYHGGGFGLFVPFFLFLAISGGLVMLALNSGFTGHHYYGLLFAALVTGGLCLGFLAMMVAGLLSRKRDRDPPQ